MARLPVKVRLELRLSRVDGIGVFAATRIRAGEKVAPGIADVDFESLVPWRDLERYEQIVKQKVRQFCIGTPDGFIPPPGFDFNKLSIDWYFNHSCDGALGFDEEGDFIALRDIERGSEITYDYALAESNPDFRMFCNCGSPDCRQVITGSDWKNEEFQVKHRDHMLPYLRHLIHATA